MNERMQQPADPIVVIGAGGHGKVVADILLASGASIAGFLDDTRPVGSVVIAGLAVLGPLEWLRSTRCRVVLGVGDNKARARLAEQIVALGSEVVSAIHPRAVVSASASVGAGVVVMAGAVINPSASIEAGAIINTGAVIEHDCVIGAFAHISPNAALGGECRVGAHAHVGIGATMLPRTALGARSTVGGGAVVTREVPIDAVAVGVPARVVRSLGPLDV